MKDRQRLILLVMGLAVLSSVFTLLIKIKKNRWGRSLPMMGVNEQMVVKPFTGSTAKTMDMVEPSLQVEPEIAVNNKMVIPPYYPEGNDALNVNERVYEMYGHYGVVVDDVGLYIRSIKEYILSIDGRVLSSSMSSNQRYKTAYISAKVPVAKFDEANSRVTEGVKEIVNENVNSQDVTGQRVQMAEDLAKLEEEKAEKEIDLLGAPTEVARRRIELEIKRLETQIASIKQSQNNAEQRVEYATLSVSAADSLRYFNPRAELPLWEVLQEAVHSLGGVGYLAGYLAIWIAVYAVIWLPIILVMRAIFVKLRR